MFSFRGEERKEKKRKEERVLAISIVFFWRPFFCHRSELELLFGLVFSASYVTSSAACIRLCVFFSYLEGGREKGNWARMERKLRGEIGKYVLYAVLCRCATSTLVACEAEMAVSTPSAS